MSRRIELNRTLSRLGVLGVIVLLEEGEEEREEEDVEAFNEDKKVLRDIFYRLEFVFWFYCKNCFLWIEFYKYEIERYERRSYFSF